MPAPHGQNAATLMKHTSIPRRYIYTYNPGMNANEDNSQGRLLGVKNVVGETLNEINSSSHAGVFSRFQHV